MCACTLCSAMWACVDLVEIERIEQVIQLAILLRLLELDIVLLKAVQCQLALVVNVDLHRLQKPHSSSTTLPSGRGCVIVHSEVQDGE